MPKSQKYWIGQYQNVGALWIHSENPKQPHALLSSGKHSSGFFNSELVMQDPFLLDDAALDLVKSFEPWNYDIVNVSRVVGPAMGAITLAHDVARHLSVTRKKPCLRAYTEKELVDGLETMVFKRTTINPSECILLVEDVLTTGGSVEKAVQAVLEAGGVPLPYVAVLVNRSGLTEVGGRKIIALIDHHMPIWEADECPLCKAGSEALRPKGAENWVRLNAEY